MISPDLHDDTLYAGCVALDLFILSIGITFEIIGFLLWHRKIAPNRFIGIKLKSMGDNSDVWYEVNEYCGRVLLFEGLALIAFSLIFMLIPIKMFHLLARSLVFLAFLLVSLGGTIWLCISRAKAFSNPISTLTYDQL